MRARRFNFRAAAMVLALFLSIAGTSRGDDSQPAELPAATEPTAADFVRWVPDGHGYGTLQLATARYRNSAGAVVDLIGAVHIADPAFYSALNQQFKGYDSLLYEMIMPKDSAPPEPGRRPSNWIGRMQRFMQRSLDLQYQLDGINYQASNFVHADLDAEDFDRLRDQKGESIPGVMVQGAFYEMGKEIGDPSGAQTDDTADFLMAMQADDKPRAFKAFLAKRIAKASGDLGEMDAGQSTVILSGRNHAAMAVLRQRLDAGDKKLGIFYGVGHLPGMAKIMTQEMGFIPDGPPQWRVAWDLTHPSPKLTGPTTRPAAGPTTAPAVQAESSAR